MRRGQGHQTDIPDFDDGRLSVERAVGFGAAMFHHHRARHVNASPCSRHRKLPRLSLAESKARESLKKFHHRPGCALSS